MELYRDAGYDKVTVAEIAARAGLTRRTFFRYFSDKREVLFFGTEKLEALVTEGIMTAPKAATALEAVAMALAPVAQLSDEDPVHADFARRRHAVIQANPELRERELSKHASLASVIASTLLRRGVTAPNARLAAEAGLSAFLVGFEQWINDRARRRMGAHVLEAMRGLRSVVLGQDANGVTTVAGSRKTRSAKRRRR